MSVLSQYLFYISFFIGVFLYCSVCICGGNVGGTECFSLVPQMFEALVKMSHFFSLMTWTIQQWSLGRTLSCRPDVLLLVVTQLYTGRCHCKDKQNTKKEISVSTKQSENKGIISESQALSQLVIIENYLFFPFMFAPFIKISGSIFLFFDL